MLSERLLEILRAWWRVDKPRHWLFSSDIPGRHISKDAVEQAGQKAHRLSGIRKPITPHSLRHYAEFRTTPSNRFDARIFSGCTAASSA